MSDDFKFKPLPATIRIPSAQAPARTVAPTYVQVIPPRKSVGAAFALTFFFGPLGAFYVSALGGVLWLIGSIVAAFFTFGLSLFLTWPGVIIWACVLTSVNNDKRTSVVGPFA